MKILLLGKNGQVGWELQRALAPLGEVIALDREGDNELSGDLTDLDGLKSTVLSVQPDIVVNAAAYTAVDKAESDMDLAKTVNAEAPKLLAELCAQIGALFIHYSTDYVFNGSGETPWTEEQSIDPLNVYGKTKAGGEQGIAQSGCNHLIFRTSWVFASKGNNFAKTMLRLASDRDTLNVIGDQIGAPTGAELISDITAQAIPKIMADKNLSGIYHLAASGETSWHEYASYVIEQARQMGQELKCTQINAIPTTEYPTPAPRPLNSRLNCAKLRNTFDLHLPHWEIGVKRMLQEI